MVVWLAPAVLLGSSKHGFQLKKSMSQWDSGFRQKFGNVMFGLPQVDVYTNKSANQTHTHTWLHKVLFGIHTKKTKHTHTHTETLRRRGTNTGRHTGAQAQIHRDTALLASVPAHDVPAL